jgi:hypothetical protein
VRIEVPEPPPGLTAAEPRDWTRAWARVIAAPSVKLTGFALLTWADYRTGANIRPGYPLLMRVTGIGSKTTVSGALAQIRDWGLIWKYKDGNARRKEPDEYRLTFPDEIDAIPMMNPDWTMPDDDPCG